MPNSKPDANFAQLEAVMQKGSKTFSLAARLFDRDQRYGAMQLYAWCRYCDDAIDVAPSPSEQLAALHLLKSDTDAALNPTASANRLKTGTEPLRRLAFAGLNDLCVRHRIPPQYPLELLSGMEMDTEGVRIRTDEDLNLYCYRVASVVGLMMCHVMGVRARSALRQAAETGLAMQMTNIARDIAEDYQMKRIYIPESWFAEIGVARPNVEAGDPFRAEDFVPVVRRLLARAELGYLSGREGLKHLPWRCALAVASAQRIYREIGVRVLARGSRAWESRTVVPLGRKLILLTAAILDVTLIKSREFWRSQSWRSRKSAPASTSGLELGDHIFRANDL